MADGRSVRAGTRPFVPARVASAHDISHPGKAPPRRIPPDGGFATDRLDGRVQPLMKRSRSLQLPDALLDAAEAVVAREGIASLTLDAIAAEIRMSKGGVLHHFPTKDRLVEAMVVRSAKAWRAHFTRAYELMAPGPGRMVRALLHHCLSVLMMSAAMVLGQLPLVVVSGPGAAARNSIGIILVAGMIIGTLFTLFVVPVFYSLLAADHHRAAEEKEIGAQALPQLSERPT